MERARRASLRQQLTYGLATPLAFARDYVLSRVCVGRGSAEPTAVRRELVVVKLADRGLVQYTFDIKDFGQYLVFGNEIYGTHGDGFERRAGTHFEPATADERHRLQSASWAVNFSDVNGWSSRSNLLNREHGDTIIEVEAGSAHWKVIARNYWFPEGWKAIDIQRENEQPQRVWSVENDYKPSVSASEYSAFLKEQ